MELRVLNYFLMAAREENITKAAELLHITQPTLSRQLMQLEDELGVKLFDRSQRRIVLTDEGLLLRRRAQELISLADKTKSDFRQFGSGEKTLSGRICIGSGEFLSTGTLADIIAEFHERYPLVDYELYSGNADNIKERIERGIADIGLLSDPVDIGRYEFIRIPSREEYGVLVREDSALAAKDEITPQDLIDVPLILPQRSVLKNELTNWFGDYRENLTVVMTGNLLYNLAMMVKSGLGAALCIRLNCSYDGLRFAPLFPRVAFNSVLVWKKTQKMSPAVSAFIRFAKEYCLNEL